MTLEDLGYEATLEHHRRENNLSAFEVARVTQEYKESYHVRNAQAEYEAEIIGSLRFSAQSRADFPAVGDWVAISVYDEHKALIHAVLPRKTVIARQAVGKFGEKQIIAANIDYAFIVLAVDRDFNLNRLERYLTICHAASVKPIVILSKIDLAEAEQLNIIQEAVARRIKHAPVLAISSQTQAGYDKLQALLEKGKTYCLLGSSGAGKSTLINTIAGKTFMPTAALSTSTQKGRHTTSHRELIVMEQGGILIDNPGMREVGIADAGAGLEVTFEQITKLTAQCKFRDCTHVHETGCAVLAAVRQGELDEAVYTNYLKMEKEQWHFNASAAEKRKKDRAFGKMIKKYKQAQRND
jgi:ribosome biogenesis GTPase